MANRDRLSLDPLNKINQTTADKFNEDAATVHKYCRSQCGLRIVKVKATVDVEVNVHVGDDDLWNVTFT